MNRNVVEKIRGKSREEWRGEGERWVRRVRAWASSNGEKALVAGLLGGLLVAVAPKFFVTLIALSAVALYVLWSIALPASSRPTPPAPDGERSSSERPSERDATESSS
jgi:hypothetical protein